ncbi:cysteine-rich receptor-like protein kinase 10, partial [Carya illinoinensis]|uniref:cysteine-rich receptor-like protein kinase 10 n=1 Tax=Carya illinoinensis TaxID=32201 RepID=UPI001C717E50
PSFLCTGVRKGISRRANTSIDADFPRIDLASIQAATDNFSDSNKLGEGSFDSVYKGILSDGKEVAVKRLSCCSEQGSEEFTNEVLLIMRLQHKNLVKLLGFCIDGEEKLLVYEFMPNRSLDVSLFGSLISSPACLLLLFILSSLSGQA